MSSQPEVAITIMTGGRSSVETGAAEAGPTPIPLDQLPGARAAGAESPPVPMDLGTVATGEMPTPLDLDALAEAAAGPRRAPAKNSAAKKSPAKRAPAKRARR